MRIETTDVELLLDCLNGVARPKDGLHWHAVVFDEGQAVRLVATPLPWDEISEHFARRWRELSGEA